MTRHSFGRIARPRLALALLFSIALVFALAIIAIGGAQSIARAATQSQVEPTAEPAGIDADALRDFEEVLATAFVDNDGDALTEMAADEFRYATWEGDRRVLDPATAVETIQDALLNEALAPFYLEEMGLRDIEAIVGQDPLALWGEDLSVVSVLMFTGLDDTGAAEALLAIAPDLSGAPQWVGILEAIDGLPAAPAPGTIDTTDKEVEGTEDSTGEPIGAATEEATPEGTPVAASDDVTVLAPPVTIELGALPAVTQYTGALDSATPARYQLSVNLGETLTLDLSSTGEAAFTVTGANNGQPYKGTDNGALTWTHVVPATQDYIVEVRAGAETTYVLSLLLSPLGHRLATPEPVAVETAEPSTAEPVTEEQAPETPVAQATLQPLQRIRFGPGESTTERTGTVTLGSEAEYLLRVNAGQTLNITIVSDGDLANFAVTGVDDGQPYKRLVNESRGFTMLVPLTQDYSISVATGESTPVNYTLFIDVPPAPVATPTPQANLEPITPVANPVRVTFSGGQTSTSITELIGAYGSDGYLLEAVAGQQMFVSIRSPEDIARFSVSVWETGQVLKAADGQTSWSGVLPVSGDYLVQVENDRPVRVQYTLEIAFSPLSATSATAADSGEDAGDDSGGPLAFATAIPFEEPERITFPPGAIATTVSGTIEGYEQKRYAVAANAGQTMTAVITSTSGDVGLLIVGEDGTNYKRPGVDGNGYTFVLPLTQDYYVGAAGSGTDSDFTISIVVVN